MHPTRHDLAPEIREELVPLLNARLADAIDLMMQAKQAHWNVKGAQFFALHELFDRVHATVAEQVDIVAERAVQLGGTAAGTVRMAAAHSQLDEYPAEPVGGAAHAEALANALARFGSLVRRAIARCEELGDADSADVFTEVSRETDRSLWLVEAHLQDR